MMKLVIFLTLISAIACYEEFFDFHGNCWRCLEGEPCQRCPNFEANSLWPQGWSDMCFEPNCNIQENRRFLYPSRESDFYFRCVYQGNHWTFQRQECRCGTLFNMKTQECVAPQDWTPYCVELITPIMTKSCETGRRIVIIGAEVTEPTVTGTWELTTEGTPGNGTTEMTTAQTTTRPNCQCPPMNPCFCNPCNFWIMPCFSCTGCMMG